MDICEQLFHAICKHGMMSDADSLSTDSAVQICNYN